MRPDLGKHELRATLDEPELLVEPDRARPRLAPRELAALLSCMIETRRQERGAEPAAALLGESRHASHAPRALGRIAREPLGDDRGDADERSLDEGAGVEARGGVVAGEDELVRLLVRAQDALPEQAGL